MKAFLKENLVLVAGIALPVLLTFIFFAATQIEQATTPDPAYKVAYIASSSYNYHPNYKIIIKNKKAYLSYIPPKKDHHRNHSDLPELYIFDPETNKSELIDLPEIKESSEKQEVLIEEIAHMRFSSNRESPDGYTMDKNYRRGGNLMTEMFGGGYNRGRNKMSLNNGQKTIEITGAPRHYSQFVGWVIAEKE